MAAELFTFPFAVALDANAIVVPGAQLYFYLTGTTTPTPIYSDSGLTTPLSNPVVANSAGIWPSIYTNNAVTYRVILKDDGGVTLGDSDPWIPGVADPIPTALQTMLDAAEAAQTGAETAQTGAETAQDAAEAAATSVAGVVETANPNGTMQRWLDNVTAATSTASSTTTDALRVVEYRLQASGLIPKLVRLDLFCGDGAAAARIPFVKRFPVGNDSATGTISTWTETDGLVLSGATGIDTGITLHAAGLSQYNLTLGCYLLENPNADTGYSVGGTGWGFSPFTGDTSFATASFISFDFNGRVLGDISVDNTDGTVGNRAYAATGPMMGVRGRSGYGFVTRRGVTISYTDISGSITDPGNTVVPTTETIKYRANVAPLGAAWIADALTESEAAMLSFIVEEFNIAIGRATVVGDL